MGDARVPVPAGIENSDHSPCPNRQSVATSRRRYCHLELAPLDAGRIFAGRTSR